MKESPIENAFMLIEPGPVTLVTTASGRKKNIMTIFSADQSSESVWNRVAQVGIIRVPERRVPWVSDRGA